MEMIIESQREYFLSGGLRADSKKFASLESAISYCKKVNKRLVNKKMRDERHSY